MSGTRDTGGISAASGICGLRRIRGLCGAGGFRQPPEELYPLGSGPATDRRSRSMPQERTAADRVDGWLGIVSRPTGP